MKFTLSWLKEHLETDAPLGAIAAKLTAIGLEVESVEDKAAEFAPFRRFRPTPLRSAKTPGIRPTPPNCAAPRARPSGS